MDPILEEVYSTVLSGAPYVIGAYALLWLVLMVFVVAMLLKSRKTRQDIEILQSALERLEAKGTQVPAASLKEQIARETADRQQ